MPEPQGNQPLLSVVFVFAALSITGATAYFLGARGGGEEAGRRFTPGAAAAVATEHGTHGEHLAAAGSPAPLLSPALAAEPENPAELAIREGLNATSPESGLNLLGTALDSPDLDDDSHARIYAAMARLCETLSVPDIAQADKYFALAASLAQAPDAVADVARQNAEALLTRQDTEGALRRILEALDDVPANTREHVELQLLLGGIQESRTDLAAAEQTFNAALQAARVTENSPHRADLIRQAALRLSGIYRATQREKDADALAKAISKELAAAPVPEELHEPEEPAEPEHH